MESLIAPTINLALLIALFVYKLRAPLKGFIATRHQNVKEEVVAAQNLLRDARLKYEEFSEKLSKSQAEISQLRDESQVERDQIQTKIIEEARRLASALIIDTKNSADALYQELKSQLYSELIIKILDRTEHLVQNRLTHEDQVKIRQEFLHRLRSAQ